MPSFDEYYNQAKQAVIQEEIDRKAAKLREHNLQVESANRSRIIMKKTAELASRVLEHPTFSQVIREFNQPSVRRMLHSIWEYWPGIETNSGIRHNGKIKGPFSVKFRQPVVSLNDTYEQNVTNVINQGLTARIYQLGYATTYDILTGESGRNNYYSVMDYFWITRGLSENSPFIIANDKPFNSWDELFSYSANALINTTRKNFNNQEEHEFLCGKL